MNLEDLASDTFARSFAAESCMGVFSKGSGKPPQSPRMLNVSDFSLLKFVFLIRKNESVSGSILMDVDIFDKNG